jgi:pimeloyl-ACP methyl ester carboxylesterase
VTTWWGNPLAETRAWLELARLAVHPVLRDGKPPPRGDGRPVVLLPGFLAGDTTLLVLALWLRRLGYSPHFSGIVANADCSDRVFQRVTRKVVSLERRTGRGVAIVGHSRGGHVARALGAARPDLVSHAISLGAGLEGQLGISTPTYCAVVATRRTLHLARRAREPACLTEECPCGFTRWYSGRFPADKVRLTSIYTKRDGVVRWDGCVVPYAECVEVTGSHVGLAFNVQAYGAIAAALAAPELGSGGARFAVGLRNRR